MPRHGASASEVLAAFTDTTVHRFNTVTGNMPETLAVETNGALTFRGLMSLAVTASTRGRLAVMIQTNQKLAETEITRNCIFDADPIMAEAIKNSTTNGIPIRAPPMPYDFAIRR